MRNNLKNSQNFLKSSSLVKKLIQDSSLNSKDIVYEIGPGKGIITKQLSRVCSEVIAIEYDRGLYNNLMRQLNDNKNIKLIYNDFLNASLPAKGKYKIFSNIPFNITAQILSKITSLDNPPEESYLIIQEEAAKKYAGMSYQRECLRSLMIKPYFELSITHEFRNTDFIPTPDVNIVLLKIKKRSEYLIEHKDFKAYSDFISFAFSQHGEKLKKRLKNILSNLQFKKLSHKLEFEISARPGELKFDQWLELFKYFMNGVSSEKQKLVRGASAKLISNQKKLKKIHRNRNSRNHKVLKKSV